MEEKKKDHKRKESKSSVLRERYEKHGSSKQSGNKGRSKSKSSEKKLNSKSGLKAVKASSGQPTFVVIETKSVVAKMMPNPQEISLAESRCSKCGQKVDKRRATS